MSWSNGQNVCVWKTLTFRYICQWATKKSIHAYLTQSGWSGSNIRWWCCCGTFPCHIGIFHCHSGSKRKWSLRTRRVLFPLSWKTCLLRRVWLGKPISDLRTWLFRLPCRSVWRLSPLLSDTCTRRWRSLQAVLPRSRAGWHLPTRVLKLFVVWKLQSADVGFQTTSTFAKLSSCSSGAASTWLSSSKKKNLSINQSIHTSQMFSRKQHF